MLQLDEKKKQSINKSKWKLVVQLLRSLGKHCRIGQPISYTCILYTGRISYKFQTFACIESLRWPYGWLSIVCIFNETKIAHLAVNNRYKFDFIAADNGDTDVKWFNGSWFQTSCFYNKQCFSKYANHIMEEREIEREGSKSFAQNLAIYPSTSAKVK